MARAAGRLAGRWLPVAKKQSARLTRDWAPAAKQSGAFVKHVVPAAVKPLHSLWHEVLGFIFLVFAGLASWRVLRNPGKLAPPQLALVVIFIAVMAIYGISSIRKARRISRS
jgi:phosphoglycerol transferase MdoB-like AlkP superfamily enzyme